MDRLPRAGSRVRVADRPCDILVVARISDTKDLLLVFRFEDTQEMFCVPAVDWPWPYDRKIAPLLPHAYWTKRPISGENWIRCDGTPVGIVANAVNAVDGVHVVVYRDRTTQLVHAVPADYWFETLGGKPRFEKVVGKL